VSENDPNDFAGLEALKDADLLFLSVRRRTPPKAQLDLVRAHLAKGKPLVGIRTASHAFDREPPSEHHARWAKFDDELLVIEAMKMDNIIRAQRAGTIETIHVTEGRQVAYGDPLLEFAD